MRDTTTKSSAAAITASIDHLMCLVNGMSFTHGMKPAQWVALRYLARTDASGRNMSRFAEFHATTRSAASQTLTRLIKKGYVRSRSHPDDPRIKLLSLTARGRKVIKHDPFNGIQEMLGTLPESERNQIQDVLKTLAAWAVMSQRNVR